LRRSFLDGLPCRVRRRSAIKLGSALLALVALLGGASNAIAAPPVILTADQVSGHPTATWSLPPGVTAQVAEVAIAPTVGSDGYFFAENRKAFDLLQETQTTWTSTYPLDPGTYYIHIAGLDDPCFFAGMCPVREFSQILTLVIPVPMVTLVTAADGNGTITSTPVGISCGATCSAAFASGTVATLQATPGEGWYFNGWTGALCASLTLTMPTCTTSLTLPQTALTAHFLPQQAVAVNLKPLAFACLRQISVSALGLTPRVSQSFDGTLALRIHSGSITRSLILRNALGLWSYTSFKRLKPGLYTVRASYSGDTWRKAATRTKSIRLKKC
jgi:hypothetical protein